MRIETKSQWLGSTTHDKRRKGPPAGVIKKQQQVKQEKGK